ncbi:hypothetical protein SFR_2095 [Streptomyces sp. FR-008]|nr:hypothetical protein SFR_2095 [Streptomyces sp. FR-008]
MPRTVRGRPARDRPGPATTGQNRSGCVTPRRDRAWGVQTFDLLIR